MSQTINICIMTDFGLFSSDIKVRTSVGNTYSPLNMRWAKFFLKSYRVNILGFIATLLCCYIMKELFFMSGC